MMRRFYHFTGKSNHSANHPQDVSDFKSRDDIQENQKHYRARDLDRVHFDPKENVGFPYHIVKYACYRTVNQMWKTVS
jgi:hypothetical protein